MKRTLVYGGCAAALLAAAQLAVAQTGGRTPGTGASTPSMHLSTGTGRFEINPVDRPIGSGLGPIVPSYGSAHGAPGLSVPGLSAPPAGPLAPTLPDYGASAGSSSAPATTLPLPSVGIPGGAASGLPGTSATNPGTR